MGMKKIINSYIMKRKYEFIFFVVLFRFLSSVLSFLYVPIINYLEENALNRNWHTLIKYSPLLICYILFFIAFQYLGQFPVQKFFIKMLQNIREVYIKKLWKINPIEIEDIGDEQYLLGYNKLSDGKQYVNSVVEFWISAIMVVFTIIYIMVFMSPIYVVIILGLIAIMFFMFVMLSPLEEKQEMVYHQEKNNISMINNMMQGVDIIKSFFMQEKMLGLFHENTIQIAKLEQKRYHYSIYMEVLQQIIQCGIMILLPFGTVFLVSKEKMGQGVILVSSYIFFFLMNQINSMINHFGTIKQINATVNFVDKIFKQTEQEDEKEEEIRTKESFVLKDITIAYGEKEVIRDFSYEFPMNGFLCISGESGKGKSTLIKFLCGLLPLKKGKVYYGKKEIGMRELQEIVSYVPQSVLAFPMDIYENIGMARKGDYKKEEINQILKDICNKYSEEIIKILEETKDATKLSGGQKQLMNIARAVYKNANIVILDEPTASLNKNLIESFVDFLITLSKDKLVIVVTHDNQVIEKAGIHIKL